ncbi:MAG: hypothetical protein GQ558_11090 [Thermoplasmata archaeon]|nr:hypothetical protein [Thermoplasmata archaeon]
MSWTPRTRVRTCLAIMVLGVLGLCLSPPALAAEAGTVVFMSPGGLVSGEYVLTVSVTWENSPGTVEYGIDEGVCCNPLTMTSGTYYEVTIDTTPLTDGAHTINLVIEDPLEFNSTASLEIVVDNTAPVIIVEDPGAGVVTGGYTVTAEVVDDNLNASSVVLIIDGNMSDARAMEGSGSTFTYVLDTVAEEWWNGSYNLTVRAIDMLGHETVSDGITIDVDNEPPLIMFTSVGGHVIGFYDLTIYISEPNMDTNAVWAVFDGDVLNRTRMVHDGDGTYSYKFDTATMADGKHGVYIIATDLSAQTQESEELVLQVDNNPPMSYITSTGGNVSGYYTLTAAVSDAYLDTDRVYIVVDGDDDNATMMAWTGEDYEVILDTRNMEDGMRYLKVWAFDEWDQSSRSEPLMLDVDNNEPYVMFLSSAGTKWGTYRIRVNVTDPHLNTSCVMVRVGGAEPMAMKFSNDEWYYNLDTTQMSNSLTSITINTCDTRGNCNDREYMEITVENRADLEIVSVEWVNTQVEPGTVAKVKVTVRNNGYAIANNFEVALTSGSEVLATATELTGVQPGKSHSFTLEWKVKGSGDKVVRLEVDPGNVLAESDETNNHWDQQTLTIAGESPGMGAALALLATAGAAGLIGRRRDQG